MTRIDCGAGHAVFDFDDDGMVRARIGGLLLPGNAGALSALLLRAGADQDSPGVLCSVHQALVALPPIDPAHYNYVPPGLSAVPVAVVVSAEQFGVYAGITQAAAVSGAIRRAFLAPEPARAWLREQALALRANRVWRPTHRLPR